MFKACRRGVTLYQNLYHGLDPEQILREKRTRDFAWYASISGGVKLTILVVQVINMTHEVLVLPSSLSRLIRDKRQDSGTNFTGSKDTFAFFGSRPPPHICACLPASRLCLALIKTFPLLITRLWWTALSFRFRLLLVFSMRRSRSYGANQWDDGRRLRTFAECVWNVPIR